MGVEERPTRMLAKTSSAVGERACLSKEPSTQKHRVPRGPKPIHVGAFKLNLSMRKFLIGFSETGVIRAGCEAAGIARVTYSRWLKTYPEFVELMKLAIEDATDKLEAEARRRAKDGVEEAVYYQGEVVGYQLKYSDALMNSLLKAYRGDKFKDRHEVTGNPGGNTMNLINFSNLDDKELVEFEKLAQKLLDDGTESSDSPSQG